MFNDLQALLWVKVIQEEWARLIARQQHLAEAQLYRNRRRIARHGGRPPVQKMLRRAHDLIAWIQRHIHLPPYHYPPAHHHLHYR